MACSFVPLMDATSWGEGGVSQKRKIVLENIENNSIREHTSIFHFIKTSHPLSSLHRKCSHYVYPR